MENRENHQPDVVPDWLFSSRLLGGGGGGVLLYMGYIGMCGFKGYGFSAILVINRVSILADFGHKWGMGFVLHP